MVSGGIPEGTATRSMPMWLHEAFPVEMEHLQREHSCALHEAAMAAKTSRYTPTGTRDAIGEHI